MKNEVVYWTKIYHCINQYSYWYLWTDFVTCCRRVNSLLAGLKFGAHWISSEFNHAYILLIEFSDIYIYIPFVQFFFCHDILFSVLSLSYLDGLAQPCSNSSALGTVLLQSCAKPSVSAVWKVSQHLVILLHVTDILQQHFRLENIIELPCASLY